MAPERGTSFAFASAESIWNEHRETTRGRDLDITGLSYAILDSAARSCGRFATARAKDASGSTRTACSRRRPVARASSSRRTGAVAEPVDARYPFALNTGRLRDQWHGMSRTGTVPQLFGHSAEPRIDCPRWMRSGG